MHTYYVYILRCSDDALYVGVTNDVDLRVRQHEAGLNPQCYTFSRRPLQCVHVERYHEILNAIAREKQLKRWSRKKKEALIAGNESVLREFAKKDFEER